MHFYYRIYKQYNKNHIYNVFYMWTLLVLPAEGTIESEEDPAQGNPKTARVPFYHFRVNVVLWLARG